MASGILLNLAAFIVIIAGVKAAGSFLVPLLLAAFIAIIASPLLFWLTRKGVPSLLAVAIIILLFLLIEVGLGALMGTSVSDFSENLPHYQNRLNAIYGEILHLGEKIGLTQKDLAPLKDIDPSRVMTFAATTIKSLGKLITNTFFIVLTLLFMLLEAGGMAYKIRVLSMLGFESTQNFRQIMEGMNSFFAIKTFTSLLTGLLIWTGLWFQGLDFPVLWAVMAFALNFIPTIGSIIAAVPAVLLALVQLGFMNSIVTAAIYLIVNIAIGNVLEPKIMGSGVGLSPLVIFMSMAFWGWVLGPVGMLLSVPITMSFKIALDKNPETRWISVMLGTNSEAANLLESLETRGQE